MDALYVTRLYVAKERILNAFSNLTSWKDTFDIDAATARREREASPQNQDKPLKSRRFFHAFSVSDTDLSSLGISRRHATSFLKLVIAHDLGLQPELKAFNKLANEKIEELFKGTNITDSNMAAAIVQKINEESMALSLQKSWNDTVEFTGNNTAIPTNFQIHRTEDGYEITTSHDGKENAIAGATIFCQAIQNSAIIPPLSSCTTAKELQISLEKAGEAKDHRGNRWAYAAIELPENPRKTRNMITEKFDVSAGQCALIKFDPEYAVLGIMETALNQLRERQVSVQLPIMQKPLSNALN